MPKIPKSKIREIEQRANIVDVVSQYVRLKKKGKNYFGLCPFHNEKTPSFSVSPEKNIYHCFGCGKGGNVINFVMEHEKLTFIDAVKQLANQYGIPLEWQDKKTSGVNQTIYELHKKAKDLYKKVLFSKAGRDAFGYLQDRDFTKKTIEKFEIGYAPDEWESLHKKIKKENISEEILEKSGLFIKRKKGSGVYDRFRNRIMFPIRNLSGKVIGFGGRSLDPDENAKYLNSPETPIYNKRNILYGLYLTNKFIRSREEAIIVEGYTDLIRLFTGGFKNIVAGSGTSLTQGHARILQRYCHSAKLCYDGDQAGQKATIRAGLILLKMGFDVYVIELPEDHDPDSYLQQQGEEKFKQEVNNPTDFISFYVDYHKGKLNSSGKIADFVDQTADELLEVKNPVNRELIARQLGEELNIDEARILNQMKYRRRRKRNRRPKSGQQKTSAPVRINNGVEKSEVELIKLLLSQEDRPVDFILSEIEVEDFSHPVLRKIANKIIDNLYNQDGFEPRSLLNEDFEEREKNFIAKLLFEQERFLKSHIPSELMELAADCIEKIWKNKNSIEIKKIRDEIKNSEKNGQSPEDDLIEKLLLKQSENKEIRTYLDEKLEEFSE
ncbi:MAG: DNA primase [Candidatus Marinimicrobia bacterium]|nr:DNA primase [Candidatus Neomarinimicrobiota bacterium]